MSWLVVVRIYQLDDTAYEYAIEEIPHELRFHVVRTREDKSRDRSCFVHQIPEALDLSSRRLLAREE
jgi:hypothetical protein